jgi:hypothetical protein
VSDDVERRGSHRVRWQVMVWDGLLALLDGRLGECREIASAALAVWDGSPDADATLTSWLQHSLIDIWEGRAGVLVVPVGAAIESGTMGEGYECVMPLLLLEAGRDADARADIARLATRPRHGLPATTAFGACAAILSEACGRTGAADSARVVAARLGPLVDQWATIPAPGVEFGPGAQAMGWLHLAAGAGVEAAAAFERAETCARAMRAPLWTAMARLGRAEAIAGLDPSGRSKACTLVSSVVDDLAVAAVPRIAAAIERLAATSHN